MGRTREEKESSQVRVMIASRVEGLESVAVGDDGELSLSSQRRGPIATCYIVKAIAIIPTVPPDRCGSRWRCMVFRFVSFGQLWRSRVWLRCKRSLVGKFRHVAIMKAALAWPTLLRVPGGRALHLLGGVRVHDPPAKGDDFGRMLIGGFRTTRRRVAVLN